MELDRDGAQRFAGAGLAALDEAKAMIAGLPQYQAVLRLSEMPRLESLLGRGGCMGGIAEAALGPAARPVRALLVAPGSHRLGRIAEAGIDGVVAACGTHVCSADAGDIWAYATLILHASEAARLPARRRVLQVDYAASDLPGGLEWRGLW